MKLLAIISITLALCTKVLGQPQLTKDFTQYTIDTSLTMKIAKAKMNSEFSHPLLDHAFWFIMDREDFGEFIGKFDPSIYFDTLQTFSDVVCDCMIKNDTVYLQGGIAWVGVIGFDIKIVNDQFSAKVWLGGKGYRTNQNSEFKDEIILDSHKQSLKIQSNDSLFLDKILSGEIILETVDFYKKENAKANKLYMKVLFTCKLDDEKISF